MKAESRLAMQPALSSGGNPMRKFQYPMLIQGARGSRADTFPCAIAALPEAVDRGRDCARGGADVRRRARGRAISVNFRVGGARRHLPWCRGLGTAGRLGASIRE